MESMLLGWAPLLLVGAGVASGTTHFNVSATYQASTQGGKPGAVAVTFLATDPDVYVNEEPAPRLKLDAAQSVLIDRQPPAPPRSPDFDPELARYLDLSKPVRFPVALGARVPAGPHTVKANLIYFYCSKREAWCRRGTADLEIEVTVD